MERGYGQMSVARVTGRAGVSRRTFYELFDDREGCFLAAFDETVGLMVNVAARGWRREALWSERVRAALGLLLEFLDQHPGVGPLVVVEALGAGPRVLGRRAQILNQLAALVDEGRRQAPRREPPPLTSEGVVGAVLGVVHARLLEQPAVALEGLLNPLLGMILAPYLGDAAAARELRRVAPQRTEIQPLATDPPEGSRGLLQGSSNPLGRLKMRVTYRTLQVLSVIGETPGASNRQVADFAGITDQGQISKLLSRLEALGLLDNRVPGQPTGEPNQWHLTPQGEEVQQMIHARPGSTDIHTNATGESR